MSEPMTSGEIEDVLSSIRRLVSEDLRPQARQVPPPVTPPATPDKLMLTPALRVVPAGDAPEARFVQAEDDVGPTQRMRLDGVVASIAAAVSPPADGWEAETGDATVTRLGWGLAADVVVGADTADDMMVAPVVRQVDVPPDAEAAPAAGLHFARQARRAEVVASEGSATPAAVAVTAGMGTAGMGTATSDAAPLDSDQADSGTTATPGWGTDDDATATADGPVIDLDEAALRDLVRDLIREELQGSLGERITRNIRKLVRAEIARMQATRDLD